jgi:aminobenzoyl-glutamate utilization protein B
LNAGKTIALTAYDVLINPELLETMNKEHLNTLGGKKYESAIPADVMPH